MKNTAAQERLDELFEYMDRFSEGYPEIERSFKDLAGSIMQDGALSAKHKELVAVGIAVGLRCLPCIYTHTRSALGLGATAEELMEAASVAVLMSGGPGMAHVAEVMKAIESFSSQT